MKTISLNGRGLFSCGSDKIIFTGFLLDILSISQNFSFSQRLN